MFQNNQQGQTGGLFGGAAAGATSGQQGSLFANFGGGGQQQQQQQQQPLQQQPNTGIMGNALQQNTGIMGNTQQQNTGIMGNTQQQNTGIMGNTQQQNNGIFAQNTQVQQPQQNTGLMGANTAAQQQPQQNTGLMGANTTAQQQPQQNTGMFSGNNAATSAQPQQQQQSTGMFGNQPAAALAQPQQQNTGIFGGNNATQQAQQATQPQQNTGLFAQKAAEKPDQQATTQPQANQQPAQGGLFGNKDNQPAQPTTQAPSTTTQNTGLFGNSNNNNAQQAKTEQKPQTSMFGQSSNNVLGTTAPSATNNTQQKTEENKQGGLFGNTQAQAPQKQNNLFGGQKPGSDPSGQSKENQVKPAGTSSLFGSAPQQQQKEEKPKEATAPAGGMFALNNKKAEEKKEEPALGLGLGLGKQMSQKVEAPSGGLFAKSIQNQAQQAKKDDTGATKATQPQKGADQTTKGKDVLGQFSLGGKPEEKQQSSILGQKTIGSDPVQSKTATTAAQQSQPQQQQGVVKKDVELFSLDMARIISKETYSYELPIQKAYRSEVFLQNLRLFTIQKDQNDQKKNDALYIQNQKSWYQPEHLTEQQKQQLELGFQQLLKKLDADLRFFEIPMNLVKYYLHNFLLNDPETKQEKQRQEIYMKQFGDSQMNVLHNIETEQEINHYYKYLLQAITNNYMIDRQDSLRPLLNIIENEWIKKNKVGAQQGHSLEYIFLKDNAGKIQKNLIHVYKQIHNTKIPETLPYDTQAFTLWKLFQEQQMVVQIWIGILSILDAKKLGSETILNQLTIFSQQENFQGLVAKIPQSINLQRIKQKMLNERNLIEGNSLLLLLQLANYTQEKEALSKEDLDKINPCLLLKSKRKDNKQVFDFIKQQIQDKTSQEQIDIEMIYYYMLYFREVEGQELKNTLFFKKEIQNNMEFILFRFMELLEYNLDTITGGKQSIKQVAYVPENYVKIIHQFVQNFYVFITKDASMLKIFKNLIKLSEIIMEKIYRKKTYLVIEVLQKNLTFLNNFHNRDTKFKILKYIVKILKHQNLAIRNWALEQFTVYMPEINEAFEIWEQVLTSSNQNIYLAYLPEIFEKLKLVLEFLIYDPQMINEINKIFTNSISSKSVHIQANEWTFIDFLFKSLSNICQMGQQAQFEDKELMNFIKKILQTFRALLNCQYTRQIVYDQLISYTEIFSGKKLDQLIDTTKQYAWFQSLLFCQDLEIKTSGNQKSAEKLMLSGLKLFNDYIRIYLSPNRVAEKDQIVKQFIYSILPFTLQYSQQTLQQSILNKNGNILKMHGVIMKIYTTVFAVYKDYTSVSLLNNTECVNFMIESILILFRVQGSSNLKIYQSKFKNQQKELLHVDTSLLFKNAWLMDIQQNSHHLFHIFNKALLSTLKCLEAILKTLQEIKYFQSIYKDDSSGKQNHNNNISQGNLNLFQAIFGMDQYILSSIKDTSNNKGVFKVNLMNILKEFLNYREIYTKENKSQKFIANGAFDELNIKNQRFINKIYHDVDFELLDNVFLQEYSQNKRYVGQIQTKVIQLFTQIFIYNYGNKNNNNYSNNGIDFSNCLSNIIFSNGYQLTNDKFQEQFVEQILSIVTNANQSIQNRIEASELIYVIFKSQPQLSKLISTKKNIQQIYASIFYYFFKKDISKGKKQQQQKQIKGQLNEELSHKFVCILNHLYVNERHLINWSFVENLIDFLMFSESENAHNYISDIKINNKNLDIYQSQRQNQQQQMSIQGGNLQVLCDKMKNQLNIWSMNSLSILLNIQFTELAQNGDKNAYHVIREMVQNQPKFQQYLHLMDYNEEDMKSIIEKELYDIICIIQSQIEHKIEVTSMSNSNLSLTENQLKQSKITIENEFLDIKSIIQNLIIDYTSAQYQLSQNIKTLKEDNKLYSNNNNLGLFDYFSCNILGKNANFRNNYILFYQHFRELLIQCNLEKELEGILGNIIQDNWKRGLQNSCLDLMKQWSNFINLGFSLGIQNQIYKTELQPQFLVDMKENIESQNGCHGILELFSNSSSNTYDTQLLAQVLSYSLSGLEENTLFGISEIKKCKLSVLHSLVKVVRYILNLNKEDVDLIINQNQDSNKILNSKQNQIIGEKEFQIDVSWISQQEQQHKIIQTNQILTAHIMKLDIQDYENLVYIGVYVDYIQMLSDILDEVNIDLHVLQQEEILQVLVKLIDMLCYHMTKFGMTSDMQSYLQEFALVFPAFNNLIGQEFLEIVTEESKILDFIVEVLLSLSENIQIFVPYMQVLYNLSQGTEEVCQLLVDKYDIISQIIVQKSIRHTLEQNTDLYAKNQNYNLIDTEVSRAQLESYDNRPISSIYFTWITNLAVNIAQFMPENFEFLKLYEAQIRNILEIDTNKIPHTQIQDIENIGLLLVTMYQQLKLNKYNDQIISASDIGVTSEKIKALKYFILEYLNKIEALLSKQGSINYADVSISVFNNANIKDKNVECELLFSEIGIQNIQQLYCILIDTVFDRCFRSDDGDDELGIYIEKMYENVQSMIHLNIKRLQKLGSLDANNQEVFRVVNKCLNSIDYQKKNGYLNFLMSDLTVDDYMLKLHLNCLMLISIQFKISHKQIQSLTEHSQYGKQMVDDYVEQTNEFLQDLKYLFVDISKIQLNNAQFLIQTIKHTIGEFKKSLHNYDQYPSLTHDNTYEELIMYMLEYQRDKYQNFYI